MADQLRAQLISAAGVDDIASALQKFEHMASGDGTNAAAAAHNIGLAHQSGAAKEDGTIDLEQASHWFERCVALGRNESLVSLCQVLISTQPITLASLEKCQQTLQLADAAGLNTAIMHHNLAVSSANLEAEDEETDSKLAFMSYNAALCACEKQFAGSHPILISALIEGSGCERSLSLAQKWLRKSARFEISGEISQQQLMTLHYNLGISFLQNDPPEPEQAFPALLHAAENSFDQAYSSVALCYLNGNGVAQSSSKGIEYLEKASAAGDVLATYNLGMIAEHGMHGQACSDTAAAKWFTLAGDEQQPDACYQMGVFHIKGRGGLESSQEEARLWLEKAVSLGQPKAQALLEKINSGEAQFDKRQALFDQVKAIQIADTAKPPTGGEPDKKLAAADASKTDQAQSKVEEPVSKPEAQPAPQKKGPPPMLKMPEFKKSSGGARRKFNRQQSFGTLMRNRKKEVDETSSFTTRTERASSSSSVSGASKSKTKDKQAKKVEQIDPSTCPRVPLADLQANDKSALPDFVNQSRREEYLSVDDFQTVFGIDMASFKALSTWKRFKAKKQAKLW